MDKKEKIIGFLRELFPDPKCELSFKNGYELLIAVILSAQCTDKRVNMVTKVLFEKYSTPYDLMNANPKEVEDIVHPCGCYKVKSKNIMATAKILCEKFGGDIPREREDFEILPGVGRKTANVVLSTIYGDNVIAVDTHVLRVSNRLGLADTQSPRECEVCLVREFRENLKDLHHRMVLFGRYFCKARNPECEKCELKSVCKYYSEK